jgi:hypothetical protein
MSNETLSSSSVSSSIASSLTTSSLMILGQTMHYCENLYQQAHSLLNDLVSKRQAAPSKVTSLVSYSPLFTCLLGILHWVLGTKCLGCSGEVPPSVERGKAIHIHLKQRGGSNALSIELFWSIVPSWIFTRTDGLDWLHASAG